MSLRILLLLFPTLLFSCKSEKSVDIKKEDMMTGAARAMDYWSFIRSYPLGTIPTQAYMRAFTEQEILRKQVSRATPDWRSLGPKNIGGRTLCLAFHPLDSNILFAGSAGGGLWKSTTSGKGEAAWEHVPTGFPVIAVSSIAIHPGNPDIMYIGTGEVHSETLHSAPGVVNRFTRGTYGIGILKTLDGGETWEQSYPANYADLFGVQDIEMNPQNPNTVYAATSEGLMRSFNGGNDWQIIHPVNLAVDILLHPIDSNFIMVSHGSYDPDLELETGIFRSLDGGNEFEKLENGIPDRYSGKAKLSLCQSQPDVIYTSIQEWATEGPITPLGLYRSDNGGNEWAKVNNQNVALYQGWYSHDVAVHPEDPDKLIYIGIEVYLSENGGQNVEKKSQWTAYALGPVPVGGPEGSQLYVHADAHEAYYHPSGDGRVFIATDGGTFVSEDGMNTWEGRNGSYQTSQFYANFASSRTDSSICIGGMQDNHSAIYKGEPAWTKVLGGDGLGAAIHPLEPDILFGSSQYLSVRKSTNRGQNWKPSINSGVYFPDQAPFAGAFEIAQGNPQVMYAGAQRLFRSDDTGETWSPVSDQHVDGENVILKIAISPHDEDVVFVSSAPDPLFAFQPPALLRTVNGGDSWTKMEGLPDRVATDIEVDPFDSDVVYATFSGFGTDHVYKSDDRGDSWFAASDGLPDHPANAIAVDPFDRNILYLGTDLGVYVSEDAGNFWTPYMGNIRDAVMVMDISVSPANRTIRVATHGRGVYEVPFYEFPTSVQEHLPKEFILSNPYPNPGNGLIHFKLNAQLNGTIGGNVYTESGVSVMKLSRLQVAKQDRVITFDLQTLAAGYYFIELHYSDGKGKSTPAGIYPFLLQR